MRLEFPKIPPLMVIGFIDNKDLRILSLEKDEVHFESDELIQDTDTLILKVFDLIENQYKEFTFYNCILLDVEVKEFSYIYKMKISSSDNNNFVELLNIIKQLSQIPKGNSSSELQNKLLSLDFLKDAQSIYPYEKDSEFFENYMEQISEWYDIEISEEENKQYVQIMSTLDLAFSVNNSRIYNSFIKDGISNTIDSILSSLGIRNHGIFSKGFSRLYIGNEFCPHLFPKTDLLIKLLNMALVEKYSITIMLSYATEDNLAFYKDILSILQNWGHENNLKLEVVVNDWAIVELINNGFTNLIPILGRLMNKRKKDPRFGTMFGYEKYKDNMKENNLNSTYYTEILNANNLFRFEFEDYIIKNKIPNGSHSIHFPYYQINTSAFCPLYAENEFYSKYKQKSVSCCPQYCDEFCFLYPKHLNMIGRGSSIFGFTSQLLRSSAYLKEYVEQGIDRVVFSTE